MMRPSLLISCTYFPEPFTDHGLRGVVADATSVLAPLEFDTVVATGVSGLTVAPALAYAMDKHLLIVRKADDQSHHGAGVDGLVGRLGERWIFVDDFIGSGSTLARVLSKVTERVHRAVFVGAYLYQPPLFGQGDGFLNPDELFKQLTDDGFDRREAKRLLDRATDPNQPPLGGTCFAPCCWEPDLKN